MIPERLEKFSSFLAMEVMERAQSMEREGANIVHLEVGEPDFDTPPCIKEAAIKALSDNRTHYTHSLGLLELREAVSEHYHEKYGVYVSPERVLITSGTSPAMLVIFATLLDPGQEVILPDPHYACYPNFIDFFSGSPSFVKVYEDNGFQYSVDEVRSRLNGNTRCIVINSPANPTGAVLEKEIMEDIASLGNYVVSDEIYHGLVYEGKEHSMLEFTDKAFVLNGFSKLYAMTGWRLGYMIVPQDFIRPIQSMLQKFFISANSFVQQAGITALREAGPDTDRMVAEYDRRRKFMVKRLREIGLGVVREPTGAFYVLANARRFTDDSLSFALEVLEKAKVAVTPGIDFGKNAEGFLRFTYANSIDNIAEGMDRLETFLEERKPVAPKV